MHDNRRRVLSYLKDRYEEAGIVKEIEDKQKKNLMIRWNYKASKSNIVLTSKMYNKEMEGGGHKPQATKGRKGGK